MTFFPMFGGPEEEKGWRKPLILPKWERVIGSSRFRMLQRHLDVPRLEGIFRNPARRYERDGIFAKPTRSSRLHTETES
jgi:hypothetical protein